MGLRDITLPTTTIKTPGGDLAVRGLSFDDISDLAARHAAAAVMLYEQFIQAREGGMQAADLGSVMANVQQIAPGLVAETIAAGADDRSPEAVKIAGKLSIEFQLAAIEAIIGHTFTSEESLGNVAAAVIRGANSTKALVEKMTR